MGIAANVPHLPNADSTPRTRLGGEGPLPLRSSAPPPPNTQQPDCQLLAYFYSAPLAWFYSALDTIGGPDWINTDHFDMDVLPDHEGLPSLEQARGIVRKLLADRFALKFHNDTRQMSVHVLSVTKTGSKLTKSGADPNSPPGMGGPPGTMMMRNGSMEEFAQVMQGILDRPVLDQTALPDRYDLKLRWTPDESQYGGRIPPQNTDNGAANTDPLPSLFTAIQEQLGLKLEALKAPAKVMVIDSVSKPSAN